MRSRSTFPSRAACCARTASRATRRRGGPRFEIWCVTLQGLATRIARCTRGRWMQSGKKRVRSLAGLCSSISKAPLLFEPGSRYGYSFCTDYLGRVCEVVSGLDLQEFLRRRIFAPLGMKDTYFVVPEAKSKHYATLYERLEEPAAKRRRSDVAAVPSLAPLAAQPAPAAAAAHAVAGAWVRLRAVATGECLEATELGALTCGPRQKDGRAQLFCLLRSDGGTGGIGPSTPVAFRSALTGKCLALGRQKVAGGSLVQLSGQAEEFKLGLTRGKAGSGGKLPVNAALTVTSGDRVLGVAPCSGKTAVVAVPSDSGSACSFELLPAQPPCDPEASPEIFAGGGGVLSYTDAGIASCAQDYARFLAMLMNEGSLAGRRVLKKETVKSLWSDEMEHFAASAGKKRLKGWHDGSHFWDHTGWSLLNAHVVMDKPAGSARRRVQRMWMAGSGGPGWGIDVRRGLACLTFASVLGGCDADSEPAAVLAADRGRRMMIASTSAGRKAIAKRAAAAAAKRKAGAPKRAAVGRSKKA
mmetsp:Transcript_81142/g.262207  ORF Transcript_81142/g.262207 Transcript_81142/m.262207 type:complete len:527 (-) Transcript_81142:101-1681(-)